MNNIIVIGDIHGRNTWQSICDKYIDQIDKIVFLGDYVSSYEISDNDQILNLEAILAYKEDYPNKIILLRGNHDIQHLGYPWACASGYFSKVSEWMIAHSDLFIKNTQWAYEIPTNKNNILCTHAGVSKTWLNYIGWDNYTLIADYINQQKITNKFGFIPNNPYDVTGNSITQSCIWIRPAYLSMDFPKYKKKYIDQIIGHTMVNSITISNNKNDKIILCDALKNGYFLYINLESTFNLYNIKNNDC